MFASEKSLSWRSEPVYPTLNLNVLSGTCQDHIYLTRCWGKEGEEMVVVQFWPLKIFLLSSRKSGDLLREPSIWGHARAGLLTVL